MKKNNILFTCAGRRNYLINYFKEALNGNGKIIAVDEQMLAPAMADADIAVKVPSIYADNYIPELLKVVKDNSVMAIISLNDLELPILSKSKELFEENGTKVIISNSNVISIGFDKWKTYNFIKDLGLNTPKTYIKLENALEDIEDGILKFPLVIKPRWGSGSIGIDFPESIEELKLSYKLQNIKLKKTILNKTSQEDIEHAILIQEKLDGKEYGMDIVNDFNGNYFGSFAKEKLAMRSGETDKAKSIIDSRFEKLAEKVSQGLKHVGNIDSDVFVVGDKLYLLEINPRFGGGYPFSHEAGANIAALYIEWLNGAKNEDLIKYNNYKENIIFSKCDRLIKIHRK
ncbi:ATP-grasp domain-containing protein [Flavivirga spongiicola]|uniref:ATP-grasp domain-containing protein n=1 Tax=Flavivirga spongiicola TaxID=421621 RepID=A0ABU7XXD8_9FLAO|nr:ATP-grasp domain-containing protein [Flavivirga sp. MEBiC05379]MDO5980471.1 ATP-grasp domain-containing protein [Flavivirga sp. MEBiC05379]